MDTPKYAVLRWEDWLSILNAHDEHTDGYYAHEMLIPDAVVLRLQDLTVAPLLHTYASIIRSFIEMDPDMTQTQALKLTEIADYMHSMAISAELIPKRKLPD